MTFFLAIMFAHWIADFICQTNWQATNKSKNWLALSQHVFSYTWVMTLGLLVISLTINSVTDTWILSGFWLITFTTHFITDAITSRITSRLYAKGDVHNFFVVIGFDQFLHYLALYATLRYLEVPL